MPAILSKSKFFPALFLLFMPFSGRADLASFQAQMDSDLPRAAEWLAGQEGGRLGFLAGAHLGEPAKSLGLPHFEVAGLAGFGQFKVDTAGLNDLNLNALLPGTLGANIPPLISV